MKKFSHYILPFLCSLCLLTAVQAQPPGRGASGLPGNLRNLGNLGNSSGGAKLDSFQKRNFNEDSITISYRLLNDVRRFTLDSSVDEHRRFPVKPGYLFLGNNGSPALPLLFTPNMKSGWDPGFHGLDLYRFKIHEAGFYRTTRPYTELGYVLGSKAEQVINVMHTQNIKPDWNAAFVYRTISAPGYFRNQKNNHTGYQFTSLYQGKRRRYSLFFLMQGNKMKSADNGGLKSPSQLDDPNKNDRYLVETNLSNSVFATRNPFSSTLESGRYEREGTMLIKHHYDIGKRDSIQVNDTTINYLFYPKLRLQHTFSTNNYLFNYISLVADSLYYKNRYGIPRDTTNKGKNAERFDRWREYTNDFTIYQFPDTKNQQQYIYAGIAVQILKGEFDTITRNLNNVFVHGGYRNRTRNRKWDLEADGRLYLAGYNSGDYEAGVNLLRVLGANAGSLRVGMKNTNRTPSFVFYSDSRFNLQPRTGLKKENLTHIYASLFNEKKAQLINAGIYFVANYTTWQSFTSYIQNTAFNLLYVSAERKFRIRKKIFLRTSATVQQAATGSPDINLPLFFTRNRIAYEGNLGKKNLSLATGLEISYNTPYKASNWSPVTGQFIYQDTLTISNLPRVDAYLHFTIKGFNAFIRAENLNSMRLRTDPRTSLSFTNHNFSAPLYPDAGMVFRLGIYWRFVN